MTRPTPMDRLLLLARVEARANALMTVADFNSDAEAWERESARQARASRRQYDRAPHINLGRMMWATDECSADVSVQVETEHSPLELESIEVELSSFQVNAAQLIRLVDELRSLGAPIPAFVQSPHLEEAVA